MCSPVSLQEQTLSCLCNELSSNGHLLQGKSLPPALAQALFNRLLLTTGQPQLEVALKNMLSASNASLQNVDFRRVDNDGKLVLLSRASKCLTGLESLTLQLRDLVWPSRPLLTLLQGHKSLEQLNIDATDPLPRWAFTFTQTRVIIPATVTSLGLIMNGLNILAQKKVWNRFIGPMLKEILPQLTQLKISGCQYANAFELLETTCGRKKELALRALWLCDSVINLSSLEKLIQKSTLLRELDLSWTTLEFCPIDKGAETQIPDFFQLLRINSRSLCILNIPGLTFKSERPFEICSAEEETSDVVPIIHLKWLGAFELEKSVFDISQKFFSSPVDNLWTDLQSLTIELQSCIDGNCCRWNWELRPNLLLHILEILSKTEEIGRSSFHKNLEKHSHSLEESLTTLTTSIMMVKNEDKYLSLTAQTLSAICALLTFRCQEFEELGGNCDTNLLALLESALRLSIRLAGQFEIVAKAVSLLLRFSEKPSVWIHLRKRVLECGWKVEDVFSTQLGNLEDGRMISTMRLLQLVAKATEDDKPQSQNVINLQTSIVKDCLKALTRLYYLPANLQQLTLITKILKSCFGGPLNDPLTSFLLGDGIRWLNGHFTQKTAVQSISNCIIELVEKIRVCLTNEYSLRRNVKVKRRRTAVVFSWNSSKKLNVKKQLERLERCFDSKSNHYSKFQSGGDKNVLFVKKCPLFKDSHHTEFLQE